MKIGVVKEIKEKENRVALTPIVIKSLTEKGFECLVEKNAGIASSFSDKLYEESGATIIADKNQILSKVDILLKVNPPDPEEIQKMNSGATLISFLFHLTNPEIVESACKQKINCFSVDAIPRISRAQKMDALSSQSNLAGYKTVILAADTIGKIFPLMITAAGTIKPVNVVIMGAGVAGLQAIATAKRLGAVVYVSDIRPETKEQIESLGGRFIEVEGDESVKTEGGYVKSVSEEYLKKQKEVVSKRVAEADIVITTALIPGKKAPVLITREMVKSMKEGSVIVDMAVEQGGNCEGSEIHKSVKVDGVTIIGEGNLPSLLPNNASDLYAKNISTFLLHLADKEGFKWDMEDEITIGSLIVKEGKVVHKSLLIKEPA